MPKVPRYQKLTLLLKEKITSGKYKPGDRFFSQTELMSKYALSFATVTRALNELERIGYLARIQGKGTFVKSIEADPEKANTASQDVLVFIHMDDRATETLDIRGLNRGLEARRLPTMQLRLIPLSLDKDELEPHFMTPHSVGGIIYVNPNKVNFPVIQKFARQYPTVILGEVLRADDVSSVWIDDKRAAEQAVEHLVRAGHRNIGIVSPPATSTQAAERLEGFRNAFRGSISSAGSAAEIFTHPVTLNPYSACRKMLEQHPELTAVIAAGDEMVAGIYAAADARRTVAGDLSIVALADAEYTATFAPPVTTIHMSVEEMARQAMDYLAAIIQEHHYHHDAMPAPLYVGASIGIASGMRFNMI
jgi:GntR family transcriptional regulator of arabinose operon